MEIVINDTNIFLDLFDIGLLDTFFRLPIRVHTVDFVVNEISHPNQAQAIRDLIDKGMLIVKDYPATNIPDLFQFNVECGGNLTLTDSTVIYYAKSLTDCRILTGDRQLRNRAERRGIKVSGILYIFDWLVEEGLVTHSVASKKLSELFKINTRLPKSEVEARIEKWK
jgi:rRNA-processing protein FCF1